MADPRMARRGVELNLSSVGSGAGRGVGLNLCTAGSGASWGVGLDLSKAGSGALVGEYDSTPEQRARAWAQGA